jgi:hypothetical protein
MKLITESLKNVAEVIRDGKYIREKGKGIPGQPGYKPTRTGLPHPARRN